MGGVNGGERTSDLSPNTILEGLAARLGVAARAATVFGDPVERDGVTVIPVARARWGFGGGAGRDDEAEEGGGGGGGVSISPAGYIEIRDGTTRFRRIVDLPSTLIASAVAAVLLLGAAGRLARRLR